jgi:hypothetical protein
MAAVVDVTGLGDAPDGVEDVRGLADAIRLVAPGAGGSPAVSGVVLAEYGLPVAAIVPVCPGGVPYYTDARWHSDGSRCSHRRGAGREEPPPVTAGTCDR